jgi:glycine/serine hydroxymethyltransferase
MGTAEMEVIADLIVKNLKHPNDDEIMKSTEKKVLELCDAFPIYSSLEALFKHDRKK